jgi:hypothetical protein
MLADFLFWWFVLYWPIMGAVVLFGQRLSKRWAPKSVWRDRTDMALGCVVIGLPTVPVLVEAMRLVRMAWGP